MSKKKTEEESSTEIAQVNSGSMVPYDYGEDAGVGYENQTAADINIPVLKLLQSLSPQVVDEQAKPGQWYNTVTEEVCADRDTGFLFVPALIKHYYAEFIPREQSGGFQGIHEVHSREVADAIKNATAFGRYKLENGNELVETYSVFGVFCSEDGTPELMAMIPLKSTAIRPYKNWNTRIQMFASGNPNRPPIYANLTRISAVLKKNDSGSFYVPVFKSANPAGIQQSLLTPDDPRFQMAKACKSFIMSGDAKVDYSQQDDQRTDVVDETPF